ncbi:ecdysone-induced protein 74EF-like isoform X2 [Dermacentor silvarum]|uniref:ecdysone-induced protein 74EF-like isoform X2 n=1 Tax=Dermacentor silvarum TaxID=543639 RepID=UPI002100A71A|nr:ecdysone-induced protein 74EF-like isoform X2 [Dermacentor silvarum]
MTATDADSHAVCYRMLEELMQDTDAVVMDLKRHAIKQSCGGGSVTSVLSVVPPAAPLDGCLSPQEDEQVVTNGGKAGSSGSVDDGGSSTDEASDVPGVVVARRGSPVSCCCGDNRGFNVRDNQRDDMTGIVVANGGRFPCLHIGLTGLRHNRRYFLALDFVEVGSGGGDGAPLYSFTEPYYTPRPNNLSGLQWMGSVLYFNLNSIANGGLQESGVRMNRTALASEFLLVRKSEMSRGRFPAQQQQQPQQPQQQQECCRTSPPTRSFLEPTPMTPTTPQSDWRRLLELRVGSHQAVAAAAAAAAASRLMRTASAPHSLQALPVVSDPLSVGAGNAPSSLRPVYASTKSVVHDHFSGGVWKSLPPQPQPSHQPTQPQPPVGSWHSSARQSHSCLAPGAHLELGALLHQNRETLSSLVHHSGGVVSQPRPPLSDFNGGRGNGGLLAAEPRPSLPPFGGSSSAAAVAVAAHALQECWTRGSAPSAATPQQLFRLNYDLLPSGCLHWLALARNSVVRPQAVAPSALDHVQQLQQQQQQQQLQQQQQQQAKQDMGVQTTTTTTTTTTANSNFSNMAPCQEEAELVVTDPCIGPNAAASAVPAAVTASFATAPHGSAFYASAAAASTT